MFSLTPSLVLYAVAVVLYGLTSKGMASISQYWEVYIAFVALFSLFSGGSWVRQIIHWGALAALLYMLNTQGIRMLMNDQQYSLMLVYLLAFTSLLIAVHVNFKLFFFGAFMTYCAYLMSIPQNNPVLVEIGKQLNITDAATQPFTMTVGIAVVAWVITLVMRGFGRSR